MPGTATGAVRHTVRSRRLRADSLPVAEPRKHVKPAPWLAPFIARHLRSLRSPISKCAPHSTPAPSVANQMVGRALTRPSTNQHAHETHIGLRAAPLPRPSTTSKPPLLTSGLMPPTRPRPRPLLRPRKPTAPAPPFRTSMWSLAPQRRAAPSSSRSVSATRWRGPERRGGAHALICSSAAVQQRRSAAVARTR
eukprot:5857002-Prymnesium_polylepis.1